MRKIFESEEYQKYLTISKQLWITLKMNMEQLDIV